MSLRSLKSGLWILLILSLLLGACQQPTAAPAITVAPPTATAESTSVPIQPTPDYKDSQFDPAARADALLAQMTLEEKIGQMTLVAKDVLTPADVTTFYLGGVLSGGGGYPTPGNSAENWVKMINDFQQAALNTRLGIPMIYGVDAVHGHNNLYGATIYPHNIGLGATRNAELVQKIGRATAEEVAATNIYWDYAPVLAVSQDIRWGRIYESYSENTEVVTLLGEAYIKGLQGDDLTAPTAVIASAKHYIGDGGTTWGSSTTNDYKLDQGVTAGDEETLRRLYLPPYEAAIKAGAQNIMVSFSSWGGMKMHAQHYLITEVLKGELGFDGFVVSDWQALDQISPDYYQAIVTGINAGVDMNMVPYDYQKFITTVTEAVDKGDISQARIDDAVRRILLVKFRMGLFERRPVADETLLAGIGSADHRALARQAVAESLVLLKNDNQTLPLDKKTPTIFVAGALADDIGSQCGGWTIEWQGKSGDTTVGTTLLAAVKAAVSPETQVQFHPFGKFDEIKDAAGNPLIADVGIVVVGERPYAEGVGDKEKPALIASELNLIARVRERSKKLVLVVISGRPLVITDALPDADAVVAAWLPGTEGAGMTDVLFGDQPFTGKLSFSWPRTVAQLPFDFANLPTSGCNAPLFPFGYGLDTGSSTPLALPDCP